MDMSMTTTAMSMGTGTSTAMAMSMTSSTSASSSSNSMDMTTTMAMTFFTSARTALYSTSWTPSTDGQYAGTCIFLIVLAATFRFALALRLSLEKHVWNDNSNTTVGSIAADEQQYHDQEENQEIDPRKNKQRSALANATSDLARRWAGWRVNAALGRATYELIVTGVGYLLMLAVMTFNVGYFLSVIAGIWLGTFILGGAAADDFHSSWSH